MQRATYVLILAVLWLLPAFASGKEIYLGNEAAYAEQLYSIQPGDEVFLVGRKYRFQVIKMLGEGNTTKVFLSTPVWPRLSNGNRTLALRLPKPGQQPYLSSWIKAMRSLRQHGVRVPEVYASRTEQFAAVEWIDSDLDFFRFFDPGSSIPPLLREQAEAAWWRFVESTRDYARVGDLHPGQVAYAAEFQEWVLVDATHFHEFKPWRTKGTPDFRIAQGVYNPFMGFYEKAKARIFPSEALPTPWSEGEQRRYDVLVAKAARFESETAKIHAKHPHRRPIGWLECFRKFLE